MFALGVDFRPTRCSALIVHLFRTVAPSQRPGDRGTFRGRSGRSARSEKRRARPSAPRRLSLRSGGEHRGRASPKAGRKPGLPLVAASRGDQQLDVGPRATIPVDAQNRPLALSNRWKGNLDAMCYCWKIPPAGTEEPADPLISAAPRSGRSTSSPNAAGSTRLGFWARLGNASMSRPKHSPPPFPGLSSPGVGRPCSAVADPRLIKGVCRRQPAKGALLRD